MSRGVGVEGIGAEASEERRGGEEFSDQPLRREPAAIKGSTGRHD